jgi:hypothetical protein
VGALGWPIGRYSAVERKSAHGPSDAPPLGDPVGDGGPVVDAAVEAGNGRLLGRFEERAEAAGRQAAVVVGVVDEGVVVPEQVGENLEGGSRLD